MFMPNGRADSAMARVLRQPRILTMWVGVNVFDVLLTLYLLERGGTEGNPFLSALMGPLGVLGMLGVKLSVAAGVGLLIWRVERRPLLLAAAVVMGLVVVYNAALVAFVHSGPISALALV